MKVLVLGAGGFPGSNLAGRLLRDGVHQVAAIDVAKVAEGERADFQGLEYR